MKSWFAITSIGTVIWCFSLDFSHSLNSKGKTFWFDQNVVVDFAWVSPSYTIL